jgi:hypothetical protein
MSSTQLPYLLRQVRFGLVLRRPLNLPRKLKAFGHSLANTLALPINLSRPSTKKKTSQRKLSCLPKRMVHSATTLKRHSIFLRQKTRLLRLSGNCVMNFYMGHSPTWKVALVEWMATKSFARCAARSGLIDSKRSKIKRTLKQNFGTRSSSTVGARPSLWWACSCCM